MSQEPRAYVHAASWAFHRRSGRVVLGSRGNDDHSFDAAQFRTARNISHVKEEASTQSRAKQALANPPKRVCAIFEASSSSSSYSSSPAPALRALRHFATPMRLTRLGSHHLGSIARLQRRADWSPTQRHKYLRQIQRSVVSAMTALPLHNSMVAHQERKMPRRELQHTAQVPNNLRRSTEWTTPPDDDYSHCLRSALFKEHCGHLRIDTPGGRYSSRFHQPFIDRPRSFPKEAAHSGREHRRVGTCHSEDWSSVGYRASPLAARPPSKPMARGLAFGVKCLRSMSVLKRGLEIPDQHLTLARPRRTHSYNISRDAGIKTDLAACTRVHPQLLHSGSKRGDDKTEVTLLPAFRTPSPKPTAVQSD